jgi:hypothetical protein
LAVVDLSLPTRDQGSVSGFQPGRIGNGAFVDGKGIFGRKLLDWDGANPPIWMSVSGRDPVLGQSMPGRPLLADTVEKLRCGLALDFCGFHFAREQRH